MKILIIPDSFKGSASSIEVAQAIIKGIQCSMPSAECHAIPLADGGEGSLEAIHVNRGGEWISVSSLDPLLREVEVRYLIVDDTAYIELASASGLELLKKAERNAGLTSTKGTGMLMADALQKSVREIVLCIGGSATNDGGTGIAEHLGYRFLDKNNRSFLPVGKSLIDIVKIIPPPAWPHANLKILCDVRNPFTGPAGATYVYGPQKGADATLLAQIEAGMIHLGKLLKTLSGLDLNEVPGAGAAGGVGGGMQALFKASLQSGIEYFLSTLTIEEKIQTADLIVTGEGRLDHQSAQGKLISGVTNLCLKHQKPVIALCGDLRLSIEETQSLGLTAAFSISSKITDEATALRATQKDIEQTMGHLANVIKMSRHER